MFKRIIKFVVIISVCGIAVLISSRYAQAASFNRFSIDQNSGYQQIFFGDLFGKEQRQMQRQRQKQRALSEEVVDYKIVDKESFYKYAPEIHKVPFKDPVLSFRIRIPSSWEELPLTLERKLQLRSDLISTLVYYVGPPISQLRPFLKIQAMKLTREITAENWLRYFMLVRGYSIIDNKINSLDYQNASAHFIYVNEDTTYIGYLRAIIHGDMVSLARIDVPQKYAKLYKVLQQESVDSLRLASPKTGTIEPRKKQKLGEAALYLSYPNSWERKKQEHNERGDKTGFELHNVADETTVFGLIKFEAVERTKDTSLETEIARIRKDIKEKYRMYIKSVISSEPSYGPIRFDYIREEKYEVGFEKGVNTQEQELTFLVMADVEWYIFVYMISPLKINDLSNWAINSRAYSIIKDSFE